MKLNKVSLLTWDEYVVEGKYMFYFPKPLRFGYCLLLFTLTDAVAQACIELADDHLLGNIKEPKLAGQGEPQGQGKVV